MPLTKINGQNSTCGLNVKSEDAVPMGIRQTLKVLSIGFNVGLIGTNTDPAKFNRCFTQKQLIKAYLLNFLKNLKEKGLKILYIKIKRPI